MIKDEIMFNSNYQMINSGCYACYAMTHFIINCPKITY